MGCVAGEAVECLAPGVHSAIQVDLRVISPDSTFTLQPLTNFCAIIVSTMSFSSSRVLLAAGCWQEREPSATLLRLPGSVVIMLSQQPLVY